jgi:hypothetical protein
VQWQRGSAVKLMDGWKGLNRRVVGSDRRDAAAADPVLEVGVGTVEDGADVKGVGRRATTRRENVPGVAGVQQEEIASFNGDVVGFQDLGECVEADDGASRSEMGLEVDEDGSTLDPVCRHMADIDRAGVGS